MNLEVKDKWVDALESGAYVQGNGALRTTNENLSRDEYCCLGVLCDLAVAAGVIPEPVNDPSGGNWYRYGETREPCYLPREVMTWAGLNERSPGLPDGVVEGVSLADMNDKGCSFSEIALQIREHF